MNIKPLSDRLVLKTVEAEETTKGGLILTSASKEKPQFAEVLAIGPGAKDNEGVVIPITDIKVGDKVVISNYAGTKIKLDNEEYTIVSASEVLAVLD